jgi:hypothetical protein
MIVPCARQLAFGFAVANPHAAAAVGADADSGQRHLPVPPRGSQAPFAPGASREQ